MSRGHERPRRPHFPTEKEIFFEVKIIGGLQDSAHSSTVGEKLKACFPCRQKDNDIVSSSSSVTHVKYRLRHLGYTKPQFFKVIRQKWSSEVCKTGTPYWLESAENITNTFASGREISPRQILEVESFSLGSLFDRGTFIEHYSSENDSEMIENKMVQVEFEHDAKKMEIIFLQASALTSMFLGLGISAPNTSNNEHRVEFEYKQFEDYVIVEENKSLGKIDFYIPLKWPPKVAKAEPNGEQYTNFIRCNSFLNCKREVLGRSSVLRLRFAFPQDNEQNLPGQLMTRLGRLGFSIRFAVIKTKPPRGPTEVPTKPEFSSFDVSFALECLLSRGYKVSDRVTRVFYDFLRRATSRVEAVFSGLKPLNNNEICRSLYHLIAFVENDRFCSLEDICEQLLFGTARRRAETDLEIPKHYVYVPRIIITPTQDYLVQPELVAENRVIREYGHEFTMRIAFRDEDFSKLSSPYTNGLREVLRTRVQDLLTEGVQVSGRHFEFLACSNSQLRQHGAWLYAHVDEHSAAEIRDSLGELEGMRCVATYVSRMGQCFSSTKKSVEVSLDNGVVVEEIPDITRDYSNVYFECCGNYRSGTYTFSDGIGKISKALAQRVAKSLGLEHSPSAYQIRYAGCKGMLAVDPSLPRGDTRPILQYRKSMSKFESSHEALEVCEASKPNRLYLNRQCITLLSGLEVPDEVFIKLQDVMLMRLASMLLFETVAMEMLSRTNVAGGLKVSLFRRSGINATCEPFFRSMLLAVYRSKLGDLLRRARIAIPENHGRLMMGVLDETGTLEHGQVFIRYTTDIAEPASGFTTLRGDVVVSKNPCFHPGDMRKFEAVDVLSLRHLVDCIVFPSKGPRPHTDEMSGSDLDGDKYFATWHDGLIPPGDNVEPMDFTAPTKKVVNREIVVSDMIQFVSDYIKNDQLGIIANAHLVHADSDNEGIFSSDCIQLAHMHSDAVDFPKTGECPHLTRELRPDQYPDFMMKPDKPKYKSERILGKLFRKCNSLERARRFMTEAGAANVKVDPDLILEGHQDYIEEATELKERYNTKLEALMSLYGLNNEGEVLTGCLVKVNSRLSGKTDEKFEVAQMIQATVASMRNNLRHDFYDEFGGEQDVLEAYRQEGAYPLDVLCKASAWYAVTYGNVQGRDTEAEMGTRSQQAQGGTAHAGNTTQARDQETGSDVILLSFPWIVDRLLAHIKRAATERRREEGDGGVFDEGVTSLATDQAENLFLEKQETMISDFEMRQSERQNLQRFLRRYTGNINVSLVGASLTELNVGAKSLQPLQMYIHSSWIATEQTQKVFLGNQARVLPAYTGQLYLTPQGRPAYIEYKSTRIMDLNCYITADPVFMLKSAYISLHTRRCPRLLHVLLVIVHWARKRHLVGNVKDSFMTVEDLSVLVLQYCETAEYIWELPLHEVREHADRILSRTDAMEDTWRDTVLTLNDGTDSMGFRNGASPGFVLVKFLERYSLDSSSDPLRISNVVNPVKPDERLFPGLNAEDVQRFCDAALHAYHEIATCYGLDGLLRSADEGDNLTELEETLTMPNTTWGAVRFAEDFVAIAVAKVTGARISVRPVKRGNGYLMEIVGNYLTLYKAQNEIYRLEETTKGVFAYNHLINGGKRFIFMDQTGDGSGIKATRLKKGDFALKLDAPNSLAGEDLRKLLVAFDKQLQVFKTRYTQHLHGSATLQISVEFGSIYVANAHAWVYGGIVGPVESAIASADHQNQGRRSKSPFVKWYSLSSRSSSSWQAALPNAVLIKTTTVFIAEAKEGKATHNLVYNEDFTFKEFRIPSFRWLEACVKVHRAASARTADIDFQVIMASHRRIDSDDAKGLASYERFGSRNVLSRTNNNLSVAPQFRNKITYVREETTSVYKLTDYQGVYLEDSSCKKYENKSSVMIPRESKTLRLYGEFDSQNTTDGKELCGQIWSATKAVRPYISH